jgi:hypothetical protein
MALVLLFDRLRAASDVDHNRAAGVQLYAQTYEVLQVSRKQQ